MDPKPPKSLVSYNAYKIFFQDIKSTVLVLYVGLMAIVISAVGAQFEYLDSKMATGKAKGMCRPRLEN